MPSDRSAAFWADILKNAKLAQEFVDRMDLEAFIADRRTFYAVTRCLEIISEASRRLGDAERSRRPELPWKQIMGAGNIYRHRYDEIEEAFVWRTVHERLPQIIEVANAEAGRGR